MSEKAQKIKRRREVKVSRRKHYLYDLIIFSLKENIILNAAVGQPESSLTSAYCTFLTKKSFQTSRADGLKTRELMLEVKRF